MKPAEAQPAARPIRILGTGAYLPCEKISALELDAKLGLSPGSSEKISGVQSRHFVSGKENATTMAAEAIHAALKDAGVKLQELDAIVCGSFSYDQPLPYRAALIQRELGLAGSGVACFDIETTCLSFLTALDLMSYLIGAGRYRRVAIVAAETASAALNWKHLESACLFGDGAAAMIVGPVEAGQSSCILNARLETYSEGLESCQIRGGGAALHPRHFKPGEGVAPAGEDERYLFSMDGREAFRLSREKLPEFMQSLLKPLELSLSDFKRIVPHQASQSAMELLRRRLGIPEEQLINTVRDHGNMIAASIPYSFHYGVKNGSIQRGDRVLLVGTSAGLSIGAAALVY